MFRGLEENFNGHNVKMVFKCILKIFLKIYEFAFPVVSTNASPLTGNRNHTLDFPLRNKRKEPFTCPTSIPLHSQDSDSMGME